MKISKKDAINSFMKEFNKISAKYGKNKVWSDFIHMSAYTLSNEFDYERRKYRLEPLKKLESQYVEKEHIQLFNLFKITDDALESNPNQDFLGEVYYSLGLCNNEKPPFYIPYHHAKNTAVKSIKTPVEDIKEEGMIEFNTPSCGTGTASIAAANVCMEKGINLSTDVLFSAEDTDQISILMCYIQLCFLQCAGYVVKVNNFLKERTTDKDIWLLPGLFNQEWIDRGFMSTHKPDRPGTLH